MAVSHVKSDTVGNWTGTNTVFNSQGSTTTVAASDLVQPADWNSAHNQFYTLSGNTLGNSTVSGTNVVYAASGPISLYGSTATLVISAPVLSTFEPFPNAGMSTNSVALPVATSGPVSMWPFVISSPVSAGVMDLLMSAAFLTVGTSSGRQTMGVGCAVYQRDAGASSTRLTVVNASNAITFAVTGNNSSYTINQPTSTAYSGYGTANTNSAGSNISSGYTGLKKIGVPINSYLSPGQYYLALMATNSTNSNNVGLSLSYWGAVVATQATALAPMGSFSSAYSTGSDPAGGRWREGYGLWQTANNTGLPNTIDFAAITASNLSVIPFARIWST